MGLIKMEKKRLGYLFLVVAVAFVFSATLFGD